MIVDYVQVAYSAGGGYTDATATDPPVTTADSHSDTDTDDRPPATDVPRDHTGFRGRRPRHQPARHCHHRRARSPWAGPAARTATLRRCSAPASGSAPSPERPFTDVGLLPNTPYLYSIRGAGGTTPELTATIPVTSRRRRRPANTASPTTTIARPVRRRRPISPGAGPGGPRVTARTRQHDHSGLDGAGRAATTCCGPASGSPPSPAPGSPIAACSEHAVRLLDPRCGRHHPEITAISADHDPCTT